MKNPGFFAVFGRIPTSAGERGGAASRSFLFRAEHTALLRQLGVTLPADAPPDMPTVYRADFTNASTLFLAREFPMRNNDMIFVSNAPQTDFVKFLAIIQPFAQSGANFRAFNP